MGAVRGARNVLGSSWTLTMAAVAGCFVPGRVAPPPANPTPVPVVVVQAPSAGQPAGGPGALCSATLWVGDLRRSSASCFVDEVVTRTPGTLRYPCAGGDAEALFGATSRFSGGVRGGQVDVKISTEFRFSDGCQWRSVQLIQGALASGQLAFTYRESPVEGQSGCASACTADAQVRIAP